MQTGTLLYIGVGGFLGACARYLLGTWVVSRMGGSAPLGTLAVNFSGSLLLALFLGWAARQGALAPQTRLLVSVGFCGAFTTFSTYALETVTLARDGQLLGAAGNILGSNLVCLGGVCLGLALAGRL